MATTMNATDLLKQLRGNYDESGGYTGNPNSNALLSQYFSGGGSLQGLTGAATGDNGESIIPQQMLTGALNKYYGTLNPSTLTSPEAFQEATGNPWGLNTAYSIGHPDSGINIPNATPAGYVPFNPATDIQQVQSMGGTVLNPNNVTTIGGLTYTPRSNLNIPQGGDFLSKFGPALATAALLGPTEFGALGGTEGLVGGASSELGAAGGATGGEISGGGLIGGGASEFAPIGGAAGSGISGVLQSLPQTAGAGAGATGAETFPLGGPVSPDGIALPASSGLDSTLASIPDALPSSLTLDPGMGGATGGILSGSQSAILPSGATANFVGGASPELDVASGIPDASAAAGGTGGIGSVLASAGGKLKDFLENNWKSVLPMAITGANLLHGQPQLPELAQMQGIADNSAAGQKLALETAQGLVPSVSTGHLPPGAQQGIDNALKDAQTAIRSKYANLGLSGSTMESQELSAAQDRATAAAFNEANQLTQTGLQALGMTGNAASQYQAIMQDQLAQDKELQDALASFAAASSGGSGRPLISLGV